MGTPTINLLDFANGDTDYVSKMDANNAALRAAINTLLAANAATSANTIAAANVLLALFGGNVVLIGSNTYNYTPTPPLLTFTGGYVWIPSSQTLSVPTGSLVADFTGKGAGTYYVELNNGAVNIVNALSPNTIYSVVWTGSAFGTITQVAKTFFNAVDDDLSLQSTPLNERFHDQRVRMDSAETLAIDGGFYGTDTGVANAYVVQVASLATSLVAGETVSFIAVHANTGASTLQVKNSNGVNMGGAITIVKQASVALAVGDILAGQMQTLKFDGTNFQVISGSSVSPATAVPLIEAGAGAVGTSLKYAREDHVHPAATTGGTPGGVNKDVQYNNAGAFGGISPTTAGDVLTSAGPGATPVFQAVPTMVGDTGSGGTKGLVPAPAAGDGTTKFLKADGTWADPGSLNSNVVVVASAVPGSPGAGQLCAIYAAYTAEVFPANFASPNSYGSVGTNPTGAVSYSVYKNGVLVGNVNISTSGTVTFSTVGGASFTLNAGDRLTIVAPGSPDATLADVGITLVGTRTGAVAGGTLPILSWKGGYGSGVTYHPFDVVAYVVSGKTQSYVCKALTTGNPPTNATYWDLLAQAGTDGSLTPAQMQGQAFTYALDTGAANAYAVTLGGTPSVVDGALCIFRAANASTGASTLALNGGTAFPIKKNGLSDIGLGDIYAKSVVMVVYNGTDNVWEMVGGGTVTANLVGPFSSLPASGQTGQRYKCDDGPWDMIWNGSIWVPFAGGRKCVAPPTAGWTWVNQGATQAVDSSHGYLKFTNGTTACNSVYKRTLPATPYKLHVRFEGWCLPPASGAFFGLHLGRSSDNLGYMLVIRSNGNIVCYTVTAGNTNYSTISDPGIADPSINTGGFLNLAIEDDGTTKTFGFHDGGRNIISWFTRTHTQDLTPDYAGVFFTSNAGSGQIWNLISWDIF